MKFRKIEIKTKNKEEENPVPIISDAAIASVGVGEGKLIPLLIIDTSKRPDINALIKMHKEIPSGDADSSWGHINKKTKNSITLILDFKRPAQLVVCLEFDIIKQGIIVDFILNSKALYLQPGTKNQRLCDTIDEERIVIEIPHTGFEQNWDKLWEKNLIKDLKKRGLSKKEVIPAVKKLIENHRLLSKKHYINSI